MANEKRLIDANALLEKAHWIIRSDGTRVFAVHAEDVENAPAVDAVEVVRCKDCEHWGRRTENKEGFIVCPVSGMKVHTEASCSYGEKRSCEERSKNTKTTKTVKHGCWEQGDMYDVGDVCSECDFDSGIDNCHLPECPGCGAIMDGGAKCS